MFNPSRADVRRFFFETWGKYLSQAPLEGLERTAIEIILLHPEHHVLLDDPERSLDRDFSPENGAVNPFLHMSLHLAIAEQVSIDQPRGISAAFRELAGRAPSEHNALPVLLECLVRSSGARTAIAPRQTRPPISSASAADSDSRAQRRYSVWVGETK